MPPLPFAAAIAAAAGAAPAEDRISPAATATGGGVTSGRDEGTYSVRAIANGGGVFSGRRISAAVVGGGVAALGEGTDAAGTALASSFPHPRQNL
jgi:hypothetical protein